MGGNRWWRSSTCRFSWSSGRNYYGSRRNIVKILKNDEPGNVVWRSKENHRRNNNQLTKEWDDFMSNPENRTEESVMKFRDRMEKKYFNNNTGDLQ